MARPKKGFRTTTMKVPVTFRELVVREAKERGVDTTDYLEGKRVIPA